MKEKKEKKNKKKKQQQENKKNKKTKNHSPEDVFGAAGRLGTLHSQAARLRQARFVSPRTLREAQATNTTSVETNNPTTATSSEGRTTVIGSVGDRGNDGVDKSEEQS